MKLPLSWINEIINLNAAPHQVAKMLTQAGLEVDSFALLPTGFERVVVAEVLRVEKHPEADHLQIATVTTGEETYVVVCGAPNCRAGIKTAFAKIGAQLTLPAGEAIQVKKAKLRGVESSGMLCSEKELGLGEDDQGIMEFEEHIALGADVAEMYADHLFDISLTPNLGHCASVIGVARELFAATAQPLALPSFTLVEEEALPCQEEISLEVDDKAKCFHYACRVIKGVAVQPSPLWLQKRLLASGFRPVNNVVDITNYVLLERGHPLHAFDLALIKGRRLIVRQAAENECFTTLDGKRRVLQADDLVIADQEGAIALAGVMGGLNAEVTDATATILLESALFEPASIRRTSKRHALQTESSRRFERGADPENVLAALDRAAFLIQAIAGGVVCKGVVEERASPRQPPKAIACRLSRIGKLLGVPLSLSEVESIFERLQMRYEWDGQDVFHVQIPSYRVDITEEIDLVEEVARIYGFDNIPKKAGRATVSPLPFPPLYLFEQEVKSCLLAEGMQEFLTCDLIGPTLLGRLGQLVEEHKGCIQVLNPTSVEQSTLRTSLLPGMLEAAKYNFDHDTHDLCAFEVGKVHFKQEEQYKEKLHAALLLMGGKMTGHYDKKDAEWDFFDLKGIVENLLQQLRFQAPLFKNSGLPHFHPGRQATIYFGSQAVGSIGEIHPKIQKRVDVARKLLFGEIDLHELYLVERAAPQFEPLPMFPASSRDLTITVPEDVPIQEVFTVIHSIPSRLLEKAELKDIYRSDKLGMGIKNVTIHFVYRDKNKTIAQQAVDAEHARITSQIASTF